MNKIGMNEATIALLKRDMRADQTLEHRIVELLEADRKLKQIGDLIYQVEKILRTDLCPKDKIGPISETIARMRAKLS